MENEFRDFVNSIAKDAMINSVAALIRQEYPCYSLEEAKTEALTLLKRGYPNWSKYVRYVPKWLDAGQILHGRYIK